MSLSVTSKKQFRVILDFDVYEDFEPNNINWKKVFEIEGSEDLNVQIEDYTESDEIW